MGRASNRHSGVSPVLALFWLCNIVFAGTVSPRTEHSQTGPGTHMAPRILTHPRSQVAPPGGLVTLECSAAPSDVMITWRYNGQELSNSESLGIRVDGSRLHLLSFEREGAYTCVASNALATVVSQVAVLKNAFLGEFTGSAHTVVVEATFGNTAVIPCTPPPGNPPPTVSFLKDNVSLQMNPERHRIMPSGNLQIHPVDGQDTGVYRCVTTNPVTGARRLSPNVVEFKAISPRYNSPPRFMQSPREEYEVIQGQNLTIECVVQGSPVPVVLWSKHLGDLPAGRHTQVWGNLVIRDIQLLDQGTFICTTMNNVGPPNASVAKVTVIEPPGIRIPPLNQVAIEGATVNFQCFTRGRGVRTTWLYNGQPIRSQQYIHVTESSLTLTRVSKQQSGIYQCVASSDLGQVSAPAHLQVKGHGEVDFTWPTLPGQEQGTRGTQVASSDGTRWVTVMAAVPSLDATVPRPVMTVTPSNTTVAVGQNVVLPCSARLAENPPLSPAGNSGQRAPSYNVDQARIKYYWFHYGEQSIYSTSGNGDDATGTGSDLSNNGGSRSSASGAPSGGSVGSVRRGGEEVRDGGSGGDATEPRFIMEPRGSLRIEGVQARDRGRFVCLAMNGGGNDEASAYLTVTDSADMGDDDEDAPLPFNENMVPPSAPEITRIADNAVRLSWNVPENDGLSIQFFRIQYRDISASSRDERRWRTEDEIIAGHTHQADVRRLEPGATYRFRVLAVYSNNDNAWGENSRKFELETDRPATPSTRPIIKEVRPRGVDSMALLWMYQSQDISPIEGFIIYYKQYDSRETADEPYLQKQVMGADTTRFVLTGLKPGTHYNFQIASYNSAGVGPVSVDVVEQTFASPDMNPNFPDFPPPGHGNGGLIGHGGNGYDPNRQLPDFSFPARPATTTRAPYSYVPGRAGSGRAGSQDTLLYGVLGLVLGVLLLVLLICVFACWRRQRKQRREDPGKYSDGTKPIYSDSIRKKQFNNGNHFLLGQIGNQPSNGSVPHSNASGSNGLPRNGSVGTNAMMFTSFQPGANNGQFTLTGNPLNEYDETQQPNRQHEQDLDILRANIQQAFHVPPPQPPERGIPSYNYSATEYAKRPHHPYFEVDQGAELGQRMPMSSFDPDCAECSYGSRPGSRADYPFTSQACPPEYSSLRLHHSPAGGPAAHRLSGAEYPDYVGSLRRPKTNPHVGYDGGYRASPDHIPRSHERPPFRANGNAAYDMYTNRAGCMAPVHQQRLYDAYNGSSQDTAYGSGAVSDVYEQLGSEKSYSGSSQVSGRQRQPRGQNRKANFVPIMPAPRTNGAYPNSGSPHASPTESGDRPPQLPPRNSPPTSQQGARLDPQTRDKPVPASRSILLHGQGSSSSSSTSETAHAGGSVGGALSSQSSDRTSGDRLDSVRAGSEHPTDNGGSMSPQVSVCTDGRVLESDLDFDHDRLSDNERDHGAGFTDMTDSHVSSSLMGDEEEIERGYEHENSEDEEGNEQTRLTKPLFSTPAVNKLPCMAPYFGGSPITSPIASPRTAESQPLVGYGSKNIPRVNDYPSDDDNDPS